MSKTSEASLQTILIVDDDSDMTLVLRDFLRGQGFAAASAASAAGALTWLSTHPLPNLVLSDVMMGAMSGIDFTRRITSEYPGLPVILFSVFEGNEQAALRSGARRFLRKPFRLQTLAEILNEELCEKAARG